MENEDDDDPCRFSGFCPPLETMAAIVKMTKQMMRLVATAVRIVGELMVGF
jgi:hypothetical protein